MAETINCTAESLLDASACFSCIPKGQQQQVLIWLLANIAGGSTDPATLVSQSKCMSCIPREMREAVITYLLCQIAGSGTTPSTDCPQDMKVAWTPTGVDLGDSMGFLTHGDIPGVTKIEFLQTSSLGGYDIEVINNLIELDFPNLISIDLNNTQRGSLTIVANAALTKIDAPLLEFVGGKIEIEYNDLSQGINLASFASTNETSVSVSFNTGLTTLSFPALTALESLTNKIFQVSSNDVLSSLSFPVLATMSGYLKVENNPLLTALDLGSLTALEDNADLFINGNLALASIDLSVLNSASGISPFLRINGNTSLISIDLSSLINFGSGGAEFVISGNTTLQSILVPNLLLDTGTATVDCSGNALSVSTVQQILRRCVLSGLTTSTINLSGGTNAGTASLNAQGQADVATLGAQLTINP